MRYLIGHLFPPKGYDDRSFLWKLTTFAIVVPVLLAAPLVALLVLWLLVLVNQASIGAAS